MSTPTVTHAERAFQIWPLLVYAAKSRQILTYELVEELTGGKLSVRFGDALDRIHTYCMVNKLPPLSMLVVRQSGLPGPGFTAIDIKTPEDFASTLQAIFNFDWSNHRPKHPSILEEINKEYRAKHPA